MSGHLMMLQHLLTELIRACPERARILSSADRMIEDYYSAFNRGEHHLQGLSEDDATAIGGGANYTLIKIKQDLLEQ